MLNSEESEDGSGGGGDKSDGEDAERFHWRREKKEVVVMVEEVTRVVWQVMSGGEVEKAKRKAKEYGEKGRRVEEGGSIFEDVKRLVELGACWRLRRIQMPLVIMDHLVC